MRPLDYGTILLGLTATVAESAHSNNIQLIELLFCELRTWGIGGRVVPNHRVTNESGEGTTWRA